MKIGTSVKVVAVSILVVAFSIFIGLPRILFPHRDKALTERAQLREMEKQTEIMERKEDHLYNINRHLKRIAEAIERGQ
jgi:hypothetical protein